MNPWILARYDMDDPVIERARTRRAVACEVSFTSGACGTAKVTVFDSLDDEDRGGCVIRLEMGDGDGAFCPVATDRRHGVDIHLAGDAEAESFLVALSHVLRQRSRRPSGSISSINIELPNDEQ